MKMKMKIFAVALLLLVSSCGSDKKYTIKDSSGNYYNTDSYETTEEGCIKFKDVCSCDETDPGVDTKICGSYTVTENKIEK
jgi:hypothetical protein